MTTLTRSTHRGERIPLEYIIPHVERRVVAWYGGAGADLASERPYITPDAIRADHPEWRSSAEAVPVLLIAERAGVSPSTLGGWLRAWQKGRAEGRTIGFFDVDGLVVALGDTGLWRSDPNLRAAREAAEAACMLPEEPTERMPR
jgi:hypothetical protein